MVDTFCLKCKIILYISMEWWVQYWWKAWYSELELWTGVCL